MFTTDPTNPTPTMQAFAAHRADAHDVFRALVGYKNWLVPVAALTGHYGRPSPSQRLAYSRSAEFPPGELWLFTDDDAAQRAVAAGCSLGAYATGLAGVDLFARLPPGGAAVRVNPVSPAELTWNFPPEAFAIAAAWSEVLRFEQTVRDWAAGAPVDLAAVAAYPQFEAFTFPNKTVLTMPEQGGMLNPAVVCTAPDCAKAILRRVPEAMRAELQVVFTTGRELVEKLPEQGMDGLMLNPAGPGPSFPLRFPGR